MVFEFSTGGVMFSQYKILLLEHRSRGYLGIMMKLQVLLPKVVYGYKIFLLCLFITDFIFGRQLLLIFTFFWLNNIFNLRRGGKCLSICSTKFVYFYGNILLLEGLSPMICRWCELSFFWSCFRYSNLML